MAGITKTAKVAAGEDVSIVFGPIYNSSGVAIDFTGASSATYRVTTGMGGGSTIFSKTIGSGISAPSTIFVVTLSDTDTDIVAGQYWHECKIVVSSFTYQVLDPSPFIVLASAI